MDMCVAVKGRNKIEIIIFVPINLFRDSYMCATLFILQRISICNNIYMIT